MSSRRWKMMCGVLAALTLYAWTRGPNEPVPVAAASRPRPTGYRPLRVSAAALGTSTAEIVARLLASRSHAEMKGLAEQLGAVGDDAAIDAVFGLVSDPRPGVPELIINAIGAIGTDHAVDLLIDLADDPREGIEWAAIYALGTTGHERAEDFLVGLAKRNNSTAITALGQIGTDHAVEVLYRIASAGNDESSRSAITTLGQVDTRAAAAALSRLIDSPSVETAVKALEAVKNVDHAMLAKLAAIAKAGESRLVRPALLAIAHVGDDAIPLLRELALGEASLDVRKTAVQALGTIDANDVVETLGALVESADDEIAREAARSLARSDAPEARDMLISAALSERAEATQAVEALVTMQGPEIDEVLLEIGKAGEYGATQALATLLTRDHGGALVLVVARAGSRSADERIAAFEMLANAGTETTSAKLLDLVRAEHGEHKPRALELVTRARPGDPQVTQLLRDSLHAMNPEEKRAAASALGRVGTDEARDALVSALSTGDDDLAVTVLGALSSYRLDEAASNAIYAAASGNPALRPEAMRRLLGAGSPAGLRLAESAIAGEPSEATRAIQLLAELATPGANELIVRGTRASDENVRVAAISALAQTRPEDAVDVVSRSLRDSSSRVREYAASALGTLGGDRARDALISLSRSSDPLDRMSAVQNMPSDATSRQRARELLRDSNNSVAYYAMRSLARSDEGAATLRAFVFDASASEDMRYNAAQMLEGWGHADTATRAWLERARAARYQNAYDYEY